MSVRRPYPSDVSNARWQFISRLIDDSPSHGRKRSTELREVVNAINYRWSTGCTWRMLPHDYPKWETVYTYFDRWRREGTLREIREIILRKSPYVPVVSEKKKAESEMRNSDRVRNSDHAWDCNPDSTGVECDRKTDRHRLRLNTKAIMLKEYSGS
ncbi:transposase [uncultured Rubinisphaera sp.]|uniref:transposase n=1 Tax=uncultured Rubinisphaera sp. TaxID=1678686 RepID=UPI0030D8C631